MKFARRLLLNTPVNCALTVILLLVGACGGPTAPQPPVAASDVTAEPGPGYVTVSWTDNSDDETGFQIFREATGAVTSQLAGNKVGEVEADETSFVDLDIEPDQEYEYSVVAMNEVGSSSAAAAPAGTLVPIGVDLMVGTNNRRLSQDSNGTIFAVYFVFPEAMLEDQTDVFEIDITGPPGWNEDSILHYECGWDQCDRPSGFAIGSHNEVTAVAGDYAVTVAADGQRYSATASLADAGFKFPRPTDITVTNASASGATVTWTAPAGTKSHFITLFTGRYGEYIDSWVLDGGSSLSVDNLALDDGFYGFEIVPFNADISTYPLKVEPFGLSYLYREFGVGEIYSPECTSADQAIAIPDAALHQALRDVLQIPTGDITCIDMARLTFIDAEDAGIVDLEGLQYALNLSDVYFHGNDITDISPLAGLTKMWHLNLNLNEVTDVSPLTNLTELRQLHLCCTTGNITDVTPLEALTKMEGLNLSDHRLGDDLLWPLLENYPNLTGLWIGTNDLTDFGQLSSHPQLEVLQIGGHVIDDLSPVAALENLRELQIYWSDIADLTPLYDMTYLSALDISGLELADIAFLEEFVDLERLQLGDNLVTSLAPLVANTGIGAGDYVDVRNNQLDLEDAAVQSDIQTLLARGVDLDYE